jgi:hypothetical protein
MGNHLNLCRKLIRHSCLLDVDECRIGEDIGIGQGSIALDDAFLLHSLNPKISLALNKNSLALF